MSGIDSIAFSLGIGVLGGPTPLYATARTLCDRQRLARFRASGSAVAFLFGLPMAIVVWASPDRLGLFRIEPALFDRGEGDPRATTLMLLPMLAAAFCGPASSLQNGPAPRVNRVGSCVGWGRRE